ncbi:hypothetical protein [Nocardia sp. bgisy134]|uniref:hypothetical protein n=1 Tax=unclassified Nocardia TaxID=2637762 RepID=UPI003D738115
MAAPQNVGPLASVLLAIYSTITGLSHFVAVNYYRSLVPPWLPAPGLVVVASGLAELVVASLLYLPQTRALGGWAAAALITAFLAVWLDALRRARADHPPLRTGRALTSLLVNIGYIAWAVYVALAQ